MKISIFIFSIFLSLGIFANSLADAYKEYFDGYYQDALDILDAVPRTEKNNGIISYWKALSHKKLEAYEMAKKHFLESLSYGYIPTGMEYELGQTLFALNEYKLSIDQFKKSYKKDFKKAESALYVAETYERLNNKKMALKFYSVLEKQKEIKLAQIGSYKKNILLAQSNDVKFLEKTVLPGLEESLDKDPSSQLSPSITQKIFELKKKLGISTRKVDLFSASYDLATKFDDNVNTVSDASSSSTEKKSSFVLKNDLQIDLTPTHGDNWQWDLDFGVSHNYYFDRNDSEVYQNDSLDMDGYIAYINKHNLFNKKSQTEFGVKYTYTLKDYNAIESLEHYSDTYAISLSEELSFATTNNLTLTYDLSLVNSYTDTLDQVNHSLSLTWSNVFSNQHIIIITNKNSLNTYTNDSTEDSNTYLLRSDYIILKALGSVDFGLNGAVTLTDTKDQSSTRGTEKKYQAGTSFSHDLAKWAKAELSYDWTKNTSDLDSYEYTQNVYTFTLTGKF